MPVTGFFSTMSSSSQSSVPPTSGVKVESTRVGTRCSMAISTERVCRTLAPSDAISSISSIGDLFQPPRLGHDARIGGVDAVDVGIDVAARRRRCRPPPPPRWCPSRRGPGWRCACPAPRPGSPPPPRLRRSRWRASFRVAGTPSMRAEPCTARGVDRHLPAQPGARLHAHGVQGDGQKAGR